MKVNVLRKIRIERYFYAALLCVIMVFCAEQSNNLEVLFPEAVALTIGAWICEHQPWQTSKLLMILQITAAAIMGVLIVKYVPYPLYVKSIIGFIGASALLICAKTTFIPILSACILPIYMNTHSPSYPMAVLLLTSVIAGGQKLMERHGKRPKKNYLPPQHRLMHWVKLLGLFCCLTFIPLTERALYFVAPPLIVALIEFSNPTFKLRKKPMMVVGIMTVSAIFGCFARYFLHEAMGIPLTACALCACALFFFCLHKCKILFPPAGAVLFLPMIIPAADLLVYPMQVAVGSMIVIGSALLLFTIPPPESQTVRNI